MSKTRSHLAPPFAKLRNAGIKYLKRPFYSLSPKIRLGFGFGLVVLLTTLLIVNPYTRSIGESYREGDIVRQTIVSPSDIIETDQNETAKWREAAADTIKPIFRFDSNHAAQAVLSFRSAWEDLRRQNKPQPNTNDNTPRTDLQWKGSGGAEVAKAIAAHNFSQNDLQLLAEILRESVDIYIYADADAGNLADEITIIDTRKPNQQMALQMPQNNMTTLSAAQQKLRERLFEINNFTTPEKEVFYQALAPLVTASVKFESAATEQARTAAANSVPPAQILLKRNQVIGRAGDTVTPQMLAQLTAIRAYGQSTRQLNKFLGVLFIVAAFYWIARKYIQHRSAVTKLILSPDRTFALVSLAILLQTILMSIGFALADFTAAQNLRPPLNDAAIWAFIIPFASAALIVTLLIDAQIALVAAIFTALIAGLTAPRGMEFTVYAAISSSIAVYGIARYQSRQSVTFAGLVIGAANAATGIALIGYMQQPFVLNSVMLAIGCGLLGGIVAAGVTAVLLPIFESLFGILTDIKLLELSNANLPILGELALLAPGTNQHSQAVGQLAEAACRAIGANPLLARIGSLYHDIGKTGSPEHFVENQRGRNPHDKLKPHQSAKIITSHVTHGIKLAREIGLPDRIIDFIPQHHGTRTLHYFLKKAECHFEQNGGKEVKEEDFRYPGPKPQFKETAVLMIADSCEAAVRTLEHPTPENIRYIVNKIIDAILADDQLDECDLTLRELTQIRDSIVSILSSIYHSRIDYPGFTLPKENGANGNGNSNGNGSGKVEFEPKSDSEERGFRGRAAKEVPISIGGEVEDEAV